MTLLSNISKHDFQVRYQQQLERQLEEQELNKQKAYEEFLKEKLMIDEIVRKIYEEDLRYDDVIVECIFKLMLQDYNGKLSMHGVDNF